MGRRGGRGMGTVRLSAAAATCLRASTWAPLSSSSRAVSACPLSAARISAVPCPCAPRATSPQPPYPRAATALGRVPAAFGRQVRACSDGPAPSAERVLWIRGHAAADRHSD
jgi:hypothetical protein